MSRTFNILPFQSSQSSTYNKTDSATKIGVSLNQAGAGEVRDTINFVFTSNGVTKYNVNVTEGTSKTSTYSNPGSTVTVTYKDSKYNFGGHSVYGTLYW